MNDIEKEIEGSINDEVKEDRKEEESIKGKLNYSRNNDNKKIIIYVIIGLLLLIGIFTGIYLIVNKDNNTNDNTKNNNDNAITNTDNKPNSEEEDKISYVSCTDDTSLLNVRNSPTGEIIDGLSCFKEVTIEDELEGTDNCNKWYKISYKKHGSSYTGYACATYIKESEIDTKTYKLVDDLYNKANDYYEGSRLFAYCGKTDGSKKITFTESGNEIEGEYLKSEFKTIKELKEYILTFMDEDLIDTKLELSDYEKPKYYDSYYEIDGNLYCRNYAGKGWLTHYTNNYDIEVVSKTDDKITANVAYEYLKEDSECDLNKLNTCTNSNFVYKLGKIVIEKKDSNYIITKIDFHD